MDAADHDVEPGEEVGLLVERAVLVDVDLDAGQDAKRRQLPVERRDLRQLCLEPLDGEAVGHRQPRRVVGDDDVLVAERDGGLGHLADRRAAIGRLGVRVAVAAQRASQRLRTLGAAGAPPAASRRRR